MLAKNLKLHSFAETQKGPQLIVELRFTGASAGDCSYRVEDPQIPCKRGYTHRLLSPPTSIQSRHYGLHLSIAR